MAKTKRHKFYIDLYGTPTRHVFKMASRTCSAQGIRDLNKAITQFYLYSSQVSRVCVASVSKKDNIKSQNKKKNIYVPRTEKFFSQRMSRSISAAHTCMKARPLTCRNFLGAPVPRCPCGSYATALQEHVKDPGMLWHSWSQGLYPESAHLSKSLVCMHVAMYVRVHECIWYTQYVDRGMCECMQSKHMFTQHCVFTWVCVWKFFDKQFHYIARLSQSCGLYLLAMAFAAR